MPSEMTAIEIAKPGGPEVLRPARRPVPLPAAGEVLIKVVGAGLNRADCMQRAGNYPAPPGASDIPGLECAGEVVAVGPGAGRWHLGERVCALVTGGGYAEYCLAPAANCLPAPAALTLAQAGGVPETFFTVWTNVFQQGGLRAGESCLVHGGASGIGTVAIQLARQFGARVFATAGTAEKCQTCLDLGVEQAINYRTQDFVELTKAATGGRGVDLILCMVGGDYLARNLKALAQDGRLVHIAAQRGGKAEADLWQIIRKKLTVTGSALRPRTVAQKALIAAELEAKVWPLLQAGKLSPVYDRSFPLTAAAAAHARMEADAHTGKILLTV
ncbi:MAG: NAD(P)H-quinone oxidoreductase [Alphaproteobacteria bacterium]|nr:NAD(P)H-quinone oxidoreductase [Alphaproteobacteria bacterium]